MSEIPTNEQLIVTCKEGLGYSPEDTEINKVILQKIHIVKGFMQKAGVAEATFSEEYAQGVIALGVNDIWNLDSGNLKFSPVFYTLVSQLAY